jgi:hypothetical protein
MVGMDNRDRETAGTGTGYGIYLSLLPFFQIIVKMSRNFVSPRTLVLNTVPFAIFSPR